MRLALPTLTLAAALTLTGCSGSPATSTSTISTTSTTSLATATPTGVHEQAGPITVSDAWAKAAPAAGMSGLFGSVKNTSGKDVKITGVTSPASPEMQLHVTQKDASGAMVMKEAADGFTIKAGESLTLEPGASHVMFMKLAQPLLAGEKVEVSLTLDDGSKATFTAQIREFTGAKETYAPSEGMTGSPSSSGMPGMTNGVMTPTAPAATTSTH